MTMDATITPADHFLFEQVRRRYDFENKESDNNDASASNLVGWNGLIISVLLAGGGLLISRGQDIKLNMLEWSLLSGALICLGASLLLSRISYGSISTTTRHAFHNNSSYNNNELRNNKER